MQCVFKRYEEKYIISRAQAQILELPILQNMEPDKYGPYWVQNLYYDTDHWDIIRQSMEKPFYKEKLRMRCYGIPKPGDKIFLELKKKFDGVVYKRRIPLKPDVLDANLANVLATNDTQIARELHFHLQTNQPQPRMLLAYRRFAYTGVANPNLRITFDEHIRYRLQGFHFQAPQEGKAILPDDTLLMEIKAPAGFPLWLVNACSQHKIFNTSFSKYACCFSNHLQETKGTAVC